MRYIRIVTSLLIEFAWIFQHVFQSFRCFIISTIAGILLESQDFTFFSKIFVVLLKNSNSLFGSDYRREV